MAIKLHFTTDTYNNMMSMVAKLIVNLKHLQKEMIDTFFTNYQNNMMKILLTFLLLTLHTTIKNG